MATNVSTAAIQNVKALALQMRGLLALAEALGDHVDLESRARELQRSVDALAAREAQLSAVLAEADERAAQTIREASQRAADQDAETERIRAAAASDRAKAARELADARTEAKRIIAEAATSARTAVAAEVAAITRKLSGS
jgi:peptidoglycan hydrolase CwlO-like protein